MSISPQLIYELPPLMRWADVVHLTGVYSFPTIPTLVGCKVRGTPIVWSPRGSLQRWKKSRRRVSKWFWEGICNRLVSRESCVLHFTSDNERYESDIRLQRAQHAVIPNGVEIPESQPSRDWLPRGILRVLFIGRLEQKKGVENLLAAVRQCRAPVALTICGTGDTRYVETLRACAQELGITERVTFSGHVHGESKEAAFFRSDVCIVPSFTENFAMVVAEALARGLPVVASRGTPCAGLGQQSCGLWVDNSPESLAAALDEIRGMGLDEMGTRGREWMRREFSWGGIAQRMHDLYGRILTHAPSASVLS